VKRLFASLLMVAALAACGSPLAKAETPQQALSAAAQRSSQLKTAKFDIQGTVTMTLPAAMTQGLAGAGGAVTATLSGTGQAQFPDRYQLTANLKMSSFSVATEVIVAAGKAYVKNPLTGKWQVSTASASITDQLVQADPLSYSQYLKNAKSIKDLGDTSLNGTAVHHYQLTPDKAKLLTSLNSASAPNPQALAAIKQVLNSGTLTVDVWFGKDDHLVRRVSTNADYSIDLNQLMGSLGSLGSASGSQLPAGSMMHATASVTANYHDFDSSVTISIPTVG
jgi:hypothetical protein